MIIRHVDCSGVSWVNGAFTDRFGWIAGELQDKPLLDWIADSDRERFAQFLERGVGAINAKHISRDREAICLDWEIREEAGQRVVLGLSSGRSRAVAQQSERSSGEPAKLADTLAAMS
jgi:hypothetical protein